MVALDHCISRRLERCSSHVALPCLNRFRGFLGSEVVDDGVNVTLDKYREFESERFCDNEDLEGVSSSLAGETTG